MKAKFSIRYKFLAVMTALLIVCVGAYLLLATKEFKNDKRSLVFDYNLSIVSNTASELESFFGGHADKMRLVAFFYREPKARRDRLISDLMREERDLVFIASSEKFKELNKIFFQNSEFLKTYNLNEETWVQTLVEQRPIPYGKIQLEGEAWWNATTPDGAALIGYGKSVIEENENGVPINQFAVIGFVKADRVIAGLVQGQPNEVYLANRDGDVLAHVDPKVMSAPTWAKDDLIEIAKKSEAKKQVQDYASSVGGEKYLSAFAHALGNKVFVLSRISEQKAFRAVNRLVLRSLLFASMIVTMAFIVAILFSGSLTRPLDTLMKGMGRVSEGDLSGQIQIQSRDEIALLAGSFNRMIADLKHSREELEEINRDLENKVKERTYELEMQNRAVKEAQEALLRTTRLAAVGEVAGQAAHEVLNPLTSIISRLNKVRTRIEQDRSREAQVLLDINQGWSQDYAAGGFTGLIKSWQNPSKIKAGETLWDEDVNNLKSIGENVVSEFKQIAIDTQFLIDEAERIGRIINSFRSLGAARGEPKATALHEQCDKSLQIMADLASRDNIQILTDYKAAHDVVLIDEDEFIQVMTNLLRNAFQSVRQMHRDTKSGQVKVQTELRENSIEIHLIDNGMGISPEHKNKLFEKSFTTKSKEEGTGIGLSISRRLMRAYQGDLRLAPDQPREGAHFIITIPLSDKVNKKGAA
ncbi:MAG: HAMP domain-containing protein [Bdellovibrionales bacterium]|nr:HAMP domain-containing protein [Bdellovibrionales bacterium]